jgi:succinate-acetate transporter protein
MIQAIEAPGNTAMGMYFIMWGIFTTVMFVGTLKINLKLQVVFLSLSILFFLLAITKFTGSAVIGKIAGYEGILCGASAIFAGLSQVIEELWNKK